MKRVHQVEEGHFSTKAPPPSSQIKADHTDDQPLPLLPTDEAKYK